MIWIGALLNIDPGQTAEQIDRAFRTMRSCGMNVCRIAVDSSYGEEVLSCCDEVFRAASCSAMKVVVTLPEDKLFCEKVVLRYRTEEGLLAWDVSSSASSRALEVIHGESEKCVPGADASFVRMLDSAHEVIENGLSILPGIDLSDYHHRSVETAVSAMCDMTRSASGKDSFWVTGIQGGSNLYVGRRSFSPAPEEMAQWVWTAVASGAKGVFMQSVNSKKDGMGAGEMSLLNMQGDMTERSLAVKEIATCLKDNETLFDDAVPAISPVTMIYTLDTARAESVLRRDDLPQDEYEVRHCGGAMKDALSVCQVLMERGIQADFREISEYPWDESGKGRCVVFAGQLSVPVRYYDAIRRFVKSGGKVIIEGLSFCYDENLNSVFSSDFPLKDVFGGYVEEYNCRPGCYKLRIGRKRMWVHLFNGIMRNDASGESVRMLRNKYGRGTVLWIPSVIGMGALKAGHHAKISKLFGKELAPVVRDCPLVFRRRYTGIAMRVMETPDAYITIVTSSKKHRRKVVFNTDMKVSRCIYANEVNFKTGKAKNRKVKLHPGQTVVALWKKKR